MPLVRMLVSAASPRFAWEEGDEVQMSPEEAQMWADGIRGELVTDEPVSTPERRNRRVERRD